MKNNTLCVIEPFYKEGTLVLHLIGEIDASNIDLLTSDQLHLPGGSEQYSLRELAQRYQLVIDMAELDFLSGDGAWAICELNRIAETASHKRITVRYAKPNVQRLFQITELYYAWRGIDSSVPEYTRA